ncbi:MAG: leucine-rich repeat protein [Vallitalea sp.]|nr:leucine-rich repeat protein [Vallitalea sp.]
MKNKLIVLVLSIIMMSFIGFSTVCYAEPYSIETDSNFQYYVTYYQGTNNKYALIDEYFGKNDNNITSIVIPSSTPNGVPVVGIQLNAEEWGDYLTSITVPNSLTEVCGKFSTATSLTEIILQDGVTKVASNAFDGCSNLTTINIPSSVTDIGDGAFNDCTSLASITVHTNNENYKSVDGILFNKAGEILVRYPEGKTDSSYSIPSGVTTIGKSAFRNCDNLANVEIGDNITTIGENAFWDCDEINNVVMPTGVTDIGRVVFYSCDKLRKITIPIKGDINIGNSLTSNCSSVVIYCYETSKVKNYVMKDYHTKLCSAWHPLPEVLNNIPDQELQSDENFSYSLPTNTFNDTRDYEYIYTATGLPSGINFDANTKVLSGTTTEVGSHNVTVTMIEAGNSVSNTFTLTVSTGSIQPTVANEIPDQEGTVGEDFTYIVPSDTFSNVYGYIYEANGMPEGITFVAGTKTFTGIPTTSETYQVTVTATDNGNKSVSDTFNIIINDSDEIDNTAPIVANEIPDGNTTVGSTFTYIIPENTFIDEEDDTITYSMSTTSSKVTFNNSTREVRYMPSVEETVSVTITATDTSGVSATDTFNITATKLTSFTTLSVNNITNNSADVLFTVDKSCEYTIAVMARREDGNYEGPWWGFLQQGKITGSCTAGEQIQQTVTHILANDPIELQAGEEYALCVRVKDSYDNYVIGHILFTTIKNSNDITPIPPIVPEPESITPKSGGGSSTPSVSGAKTISTSKKGKDITFTIKDKNVSVEFNGLAFEGFEDKRVQSKIEEKNKDDLNLSKEVEKQIGDLPIFDISIYVDGEKKHFKFDEPIVIKIPVDTDLENHKVVAVYIDETGDTQIMEGVLNEGVMKFTTNHLSEYALMYVDKIFNDITTHWGKEAIEALLAREVVDGVGNDMFNPEGKITRAELTTIMVRYFDLTSDSNANYSDVGTGNWYTEYVAIAKDNNILPEIYGDKFEPNKAITREEIMYILYKCLKQADRLDTLDDNGDSLSDFTDSDIVSSYAIEGSEYLISRDIIDGNGKDEFNPTSTSTRAEVAQMLWNMINIAN